MLGALLADPMMGFMVARFCLILKGLVEEQLPYMAPPASLLHIIWGHIWGVHPRLHPIFSWTLEAAPHSLFWGAQHAAK